MKNKKCPLQTFLNHLGGKWSLVIIWHLHAKEAGFNELKKTIGPISAKVLSEKLKELHKHKLVIRKTIEGNPPHVRYRLSKKGESLISIIQKLHTWGEKHF